MFNDVASKNVCAEVENIINEMNGAPFCMLFNLTNYEGSTPEAHEIGDKHFKWIETQNCLGRANVTSNIGYQELLKLSSLLKHKHSKGFAVLSMLPYAVLYAPMYSFICSHVQFYMLPNAVLHAPKCTF